MVALKMNESSPQSRNILGANCRQLLLKFLIWEGCRAFTRTATQVYSATPSFVFARQLEMKEQ
jgi:hypothetical protein